jgi:hypothetical protein
MHTYQHSAFTVLHRYDILYAGHKSDAGVGTGRRRRFLDWYGFRYATTFWNVFVIELRDSVVFSVVQTALSSFDAYCGCGSAHTFILITWNFLLYYLIRGWVFVGKTCFVFDFILHIEYTVDVCALSRILPLLSLIDVIYCAPYTKATPASVQRVGVDF